MQPQRDSIFHEAADKWNKNRLSPHDDATIRCIQPDFALSAEMVNCVRNMAVELKINDSADAQQCAAYYGFMWTLLVQMSSNGI